MAVRTVLTVACTLLAFPLPSAGEDDVLVTARKLTVLSSDVWKTRPRRKDAPLREENITDREVLQIKGVMAELYPGSIVYISAVTTGCPCEDGPSCEDQVWTVADRSGVANELALSKIDGEWQVGPLQEWWLVRARIGELYTRSRDEPESSRRVHFQEHLRRLAEHYEAFPGCSLAPGADDAARTAAPDSSVTRTAP